MPDDSKKAGAIRLFLLQAGKLPRFAADQQLLVLALGLIILAATLWRFISVY